MSTITHTATQICENFYYVGAHDPERKIFDIIMDLENGTTYNSYLIKGKKKNALIELVKDDESCFKQLTEKLKGVLKEGETIDYLIMHHTEPDHVLVNWFKSFKDLYPNMTIVGSSCAINNLKEIHNVSSFNHIVVENTKILDLGGYKLKIELAPFLHWPDTMYSYCPELQALFCCDAFAAHFSSKENLSSKITDKKIHKTIYKERKFYFDFIMSPFKKHIQKFIKKIETLHLEYICTSHGPILSGKDIIKSISKYRKWSTIPARKNHVTIIYVSSHGFTKEMTKEIQRGIESYQNGKVSVKLFDIYNKKLSTAKNILKELEKSRGILFGSPTILGDTVPEILSIAGHLNPILHGNKLLGGAYGSYGWSGESSFNLTQRMIQCKIQVVPPLRKKFRSTKKDLEQCYEWGQNFAKIILGENQGDEYFQQQLGKTVNKLNYLMKTLERRDPNNGMNKKKGNEVQLAKQFQDNKLRLWKCLICGEITKSVEHPNYSCSACGADSEVWILIGFDNPEDYDQESKGGSDSDSDGFGSKKIGGIGNTGSLGKLNRSLLHNTSGESIMSVQSQFAGIGIKKIDNYYDGTIVIIGASSAGISAMKAIRSKNRMAKIILLSGENEMPYYRPKLSNVLGDLNITKKKGFLLLDEKQIKEYNITFLKNVVVTKINRKKKYIQLQTRIKKANLRKKDKYTYLGDQKKYTYDKLILAVGSNQRIPKEKLKRYKRIFTKKKKKQKRS
ncbi:diflavin flavoprotein a 2-related [Anaeramoeba flamelloides]|uniref:Diflavin flavoprotein a 2-related n=1 Tax=Anaeramoeba flamelloides TaxID=1746091 RepID=A0AAV8AGM7_9EUKA|nr:diflavin flavoprotein a 2-related [Anaeramoeba flamelloides]